MKLMDAPSMETNLIPYEIDWQFGKDSKKE